MSLGEPLQRLVSGAIRARAAVSLELEPLGRDDVESLVRAGNESRPSDSLVDAIFARSEGNPLFAKELLAATTRGDAALPPVLRDMLLADVARLDANSRAVLRVAAAARRDAPYELLAAVSPLDELALAEALRQAVEHDLFVPDQAAGTFRFRHALFAEAVYDTLLPGEREVLHERIARAFTEEPRLATARCRLGGVRPALGGRAAAAGSAGGVARGGEGSRADLGSHRGTRASGARPRPLGRGAGRRGAGGCRAAGRPLPGCGAREHVRRERR